MKMSGKKWFVVICLLMLALNVHSVFSDAPQTCGTYVAYTIEDLSVSFMRSDPDKSAVWSESCTDVIKNNALSEVYIDTDPIAVPKNAAGLFSGCNTVGLMDLSALDVSGASDLSKMFEGCSYLQELDLSGWDTSGVTNMSEMFRNCSMLTALDVSGFDTSAVTDMHGMFKECRSLRTLDLNGWDTSAVTDMSELFYRCGGLQELYQDGWDTSAVTDMSDMFFYCSGLRTLDLSGWDTSAVTDMYEMFYFCLDLQELYLNGWDTSAVTNMAAMFSGCSLRELDLSSFDTSAVTDMSEMFSTFSSLTDLDVSGFDTSAVTTMAGMFEYSNITELDVSGFDTSAVIDMEKMFNGCRLLTKLDLSGWDTDRVKSMTMIFCDCCALTELDLSGWTTGSLEKISSGFQNCKSLTELDLSGWTTGSLKEITYGFENCSSLTALDLSGWIFDGMISFDSVFSDCVALHRLTLGRNNISGNFFSDLPGTWYYVKPAEDLEDPMGENSVMSDLFNRYEPERMAGTWALGEPAETVEIYAPSGEKISYSQIEIYVPVVRLRGAVLPEEASQELIWSVGDYDDPVVAGVHQNGLVFFNDSGQADIWVETADGDAIAFVTLQYPGSGKNTCGIGVQYEMTDDSTIRFFPDYESNANVITWGADCSDIYLEDPEITAVKVSGGIFFSGDDVQTMFAGSPYLESIELSNPDFSGVRSMSGMFEGCSALTNLVLTCGNTTALKDMSGMFRGCSALTNLVLTCGNTTALEDMSGMFEGCSALSEVDLSAIDTDSVKFMNDMFFGCSSLTKPGLTDWDVSAVENMSAMFLNCSLLTELDLSGWTPSSVTDTSFLFGGCGSLKELDLGGWAPSSLKDTKFMFNGCSSLTELDELGGWDVSSVTDMGNMFADCSALTELDLSGWTTSSVLKMDCMFNGCSSLTSLNLNGWDVSSVTDMWSIFYGCGSLKELDLGGWTPSSLRSMEGIFSGCGSLKELDLSMWDVSDAEVGSNAFSGCFDLQTLTFGAGTKIPIGNFTQLPAYARSWYFIIPDEGLEDEWMTVKSGGSFFGSLLSPDNMRGTWTTEVKAEKAEILDPDGNVITGSGIEVKTVNYQLSAAAEPDLPWIQKFAWTSDDETVATVDETGRVTFLKNGSVTITAAPSGGKSRNTASVILTKMPLTESVTIQDESGKDITGKTVEINTASYQLKAAAFPADAVQKFTWKSSAEATASVDAKGKVSFKKAGTVTVTAAAADGSNKSASVKLSYTPLASSVSIQDESGKDITGKTSDAGSRVLQLKAAASPAGALQKFTWKGSDDTVGTVDANGKVTFKKAGKLTVTVTAADGSKKSAKTTLSYDPVRCVVIRCYELILGRGADAGGLKFYMDRLKSGELTGAQMVMNFINSPEFQGKKYGNEKVVEILYLTMMDRAADASGLAYWSGFLNDGLSQKYVVRGFAGSAEFKKICSTYGITPGTLALTENRDKNPKVTAFVSRCYNIALGRKGDVNGLNYWTGKILDKTLTPQQVADSFVFSKECLGKNLNDSDFVKMLYNLYMGRNFDQGGLTYWLGKLSSGMSRQTVAKSFGNSNEFKTIVASYGL